MTETPPPALPRTTPPGAPPAAAGGAPPPGGPTADRMQALLSTAVQQQVTEQRAVSLILAELRGQINSLAENVRLTASDSTLERLSAVVSGIVADLRTSTSLLGQRIEALSKRIESVAAESATPTEQAAARLAALAGDISAQGHAVEQMRAALDQLSSFPTALAALQNDMAGLHDRLQPLSDLRASVAELGASTDSNLAALRPRLDLLDAQLTQVAEAAQPERVRDLVLDAVSGRLDRLEEAAARPVIGPEVLRGALGDLRASLDAATADRLEDLTAALSAVENRLGQVGQRVADIGDAAGGVPALATDLGRLTSRVAELGELRGDLAEVAQGVSALQSQRTAEALDVGLASVRAELGQLAAQMASTPPPSAEDVAALVSQRVADRLVETLAPRIADVVLTRVSGVLVNQLGEALSPRLQADTETIVRTATSESERRVLAHLDEAVLALAEALLRRRTPRPSALPAPAKSSRKAPAPVEVAAVSWEPEAWEPEGELPDVQEVVDQLNATPAAEDFPAAGGREAVTTGMAPARATPASTPSEAAAEVPAFVAEDAADEEESASEPPPAAPGKPVAAKSKVAAGPAKPASARPAKAAPPAQPLKPALRKPAPRKPTRPVTQPILERTPDVPDDDLEPVRSRPRDARPTPPTSRPAAPAAPAPAARATRALPADAPQPPIQRPTQRPSPPPPPVAAEADEDEGKRKPWWRPGG